MTKFKVNAHRFDPYASFNFLIYFGGGPDPVAGVSKISALKRTTDVIDHRSGGDTGTIYRSPGQSKFEAITLERGVTQEPAFEAWASQCFRLGVKTGLATSSQVALANFRRDLRIVLLNEAGQPAKGYKVKRAWVSEFQALPELDASTNSVAIEMLKVEHEGFERDQAVVELPEPVTTGASVV